MNTTPSVAQAAGVTAGIVRGILTLTASALARGIQAYIDRSDSVSTTPAEAVAENPKACIVRTDMPRAPAVRVTHNLDITILSSTVKIGVVWSS